MNSDPFSPGPQLPGSSLACSVSIHTEHLWGWRRLILLLGQMPPDSRLHDSQHLSRRAAEGPRPPCVLCSTHLAHSVPPRSQPPATRPHQGHLQPLYQADLKTHSQVKRKKKKAFIRGHSVVFLSAVATLTWWYRLNLFKFLRLIFMQCVKAFPQC